MSPSLLPSQDLYEAGELKWGTDEAQFIYILGNRSKQHLRLGEFPKTAAPPQVTLRTPFSSFSTDGTQEPLHLQTKY